IGFYSHTFTPPEINYSTWDKELTSAYLALRYFETYFENKKELTLHTDHQALTSLLSLKEAKGRVARIRVWILSRSFKLTINHRKGTELTDADAVSRLMLDIPPPNA